jgi:FKBP-type peptidyl-prolyl cis-trans isomerase
MMTLGRINIVPVASVVIAFASSLTTPLASQSEEGKEFQGWVKTYCDGHQTIESAVLDYGSCSTDDANYHVARRGVRYKVLREGSGRASRKGDVVVVEYLGWVFDKEAAYGRGAIVDTSYTFGGSSFEFTLGDKSVIPGWEYGIRGMKRGEVRELIIDAKMAYGDRGIRDRVPPRSTLIFEIELLDYGPVK